MKGSNEPTLAAVFENTVVVPRMRLEVAYEPLSANLLTWPDIARCIELELTLTLVYLSPESAVQWLLADKIRGGPLRLQVKIILNESWHDAWAPSIQRFLAVRYSLYFREISVA